jgi:hypothetical protein
MHLFGTGAPSGMEVLVLLGRMLLGIALLRNALVKHLHLRAVEVSVHVLFVASVAAAANHQLVDDKQYKSTSSARNIDMVN